MSLLPISNSASAPLSAVSFHAHGHKKGSQVGSQGNSNGATGQSAAAPTESLFTNLLRSLQQVIGLKLTAAAPAAPAAATSAAGALAQTSSSPKLAGSIVNTNV